MSELTVLQDCNTIKLTKGQNSLVDTEYYVELVTFKWWAMWNKYSRFFYAARSINNRRGRATVLLHRSVMQLSGVEIPELLDHRNGDSLDNRKANLRLATRSQNCQNSRRMAPGSSKYKGATFHKNKKSRQWCARIRNNGPAKHIGYFDTELEAAQAYERAARELHGEFSLTNRNTR